AWLASDLSKGVSGQVFIITGGLVQLAGLALGQQGHVRQAVDDRFHRGRARPAVQGRRRRGSPLHLVRLAWGPEEEAFRAELDAFLDTHAPKQAVGLDFAASEEAGIPQWARDWQATLFDNGWMVPGYPPEL